ncbi:MAG: associated Golgi protein [Proteobacteria bacterium]|nr:associated Golgi protein [Pseudomonadota bacterium]
MAPDPGAAWPRLNARRALLLAILLGLIAAYSCFDLGRLLSLDYVKSQQAAIESWRAAQPLVAALLYFAAYVAFAALSLPASALMSLLGGALFGLFWGVLLASFASSLGATLAFLASRFVLRDWVQQRYGKQLRFINCGIERDGVAYLFTLRLVPVFPFFIVNLLIGLTPLPTWTFYWVSQTGMLASALIYVNAGTQLAQIETLSAIVSPTLLVSLALLGLLPLIGRKITNAIAARKG